VTIARAMAALVVEHHIQPSEVDRMTVSDLFWWIHRINLHMKERA